jgi:hypothetical protein
MLVGGRDIYGDDYFIQITKVTQIKYASGQIRFPS